MRYLLYLCISSLIANATTFDPDLIVQALDQANVVANVQVLKNETQKQGNNPIERISEVRLLSLLRLTPGLQSNVSPGEKLFVHSLGGEADGVGEYLSGYPRLYPGRRYRLFLKEISAGHFEVAGMDRGAVSLDSHRNFTQNRTDGSDGKGTGEFLHWDFSYFPIPFFISSPTFAGHPEMIAAIEASFKTWRDPQDLFVEFIAMGCSSASRNDNDGMNNVIYVKQGWRFEPAAIAITRNFYVAGESERAGQILDTDILLNAENYQFTTSGESGKHDVQNIITHEVGHLLGLGHETTPQDVEATMYPDAAVGELKKRSLGVTDIAGVRQIYSGAGKKISFPGQICQLSDGGNSGCAAVHANQSSPLWPLTFLMLFSIWLGSTLYLSRTLYFSGDADSFSRVGTNKRL